MRWYQILFVLFLVLGFSTFNSGCNCDGEVTCESSDDCSAPKTCLDVGGKKICTVKCTSDADCSKLSGTSCQNAFCRKVVDCEGSGDCPSGQTCESGKCKLPATAKCTADADCKDTAKPKCNVGTGTCEAESNTCKEDRDCKTGEKCVEQKCIAQTTTCSKHSDCSAGNLCKNSNCTSDCDTTDNCGDGYTCVNKVCTKNGSSECETDADCKDASKPKCTNNKCVASSSCTGKTIDGTCYTEIAASRENVAVLKVENGKRYLWIEGIWSPYVVVHLEGSGLPAKNVVLQANSWVEVDSVSARPELFMWFVCTYEACWAPQSVMSLFALNSKLTFSRRHPDNPEDKSVWLKTVAGF